MSSGTQVDLDWAGIDPPSPHGGYGGLGVPTAGGAHGADGLDGAAGPTAAYLTDEEILGITPIGTGAEVETSGNMLEATRESVGARHAVPLQPAASSAASGAAASMPAWMAALAGDPTHGAEAQRLWQEHQAFRAAFSSAEEARAIRELLPGGAQEVQALRQIAQEVDSLRQVAQEAESLRQNAESLRESAQSVDRIDAAIFSGDVRAQSEVVSELARANPAAFRSLFAEAAKVLAGMGQAGDAGFDGVNAVPTSASRQTVESVTQGRGTPQRDSSVAPALQALAQNDNAREAPASRQSSSANVQGKPVTNHNPQSPGASQAGQFDPVAYASFERSTNEVVARDVRGSISDALTRVLPEGIADGAARRIGEDIFNEVHRALAADRALSEQVGEVLRDRRFGTAEQQRVSSLLAGRAKQLVPSVARRVIGEWTSSVLGTARTKAARQAAAASRVDIAAPGGSRDSMPLRQMSARDVDYASMSDDEILGM